MIIKTKDRQTIEFRREIGTNSWILCIEGGCITYMIGLTDKDIKKIELDLRKKLEVLKIP